MEESVNKLGRIHFEIENASDGSELETILNEKGKMQGTQIVHYEVWPPYFNEVAYIVDPRPESSVEPRPKFLRDTAVAPTLISRGHSKNLVLESKQVLHFILLTMEIL